MGCWYCREKKMFFCFQRIATKPENALFLSNMVLKIIHYC